MFSRDDVIYTAGLLDGEGCVGVHKTDTSHRRFRYHLVVTITSTNAYICEWLRQKFGGAIRFWEESQRRSPRHKDRYTWIKVRGQAADFLRVVQPFVKLKSLQIENALVFQSSFRKTPKGKPKHLTEEEEAVREACRIVACDLNRKGTSILGVRTLTI